MKRSQCGFTLVEILAVLAILGLVLTLLGQAVRLGLQGRVTYQRAVGAQQDMVPVEHALRRLLERADPGVYPNPPLLQATAHSLVFATTLPDPATGLLRAADVRLEASGGRLVLWWTPHAHGVPFGAAPVPAREVLVEAIQRLDIAYAGRNAPATWLPAWPDRRLPDLVRLTLVAASGRPSWPPMILRLPREPAEE